METKNHKLIENLNWVKEKLNERDEIKNNSSQESLKQEKIKKRYPFWFLLGKPTIVILTILYFVGFIGLSQFFEPTRKFSLWLMQFYNYFHPVEGEISDLLVTFGVGLAPYFIAVIAVFVLRIVSKILSAPTRSIRVRMCQKEIDNYEIQIKNIEDEIAKSSPVQYEEFLDVEVIDFFLESLNSMEAITFQECVQIFRREQREDERFKAIQAALDEKIGDTYYDSYDYGYDYDSKISSMNREINDLKADYDHLYYNGR